MRSPPCPPPRSPVPRRSSRRTTSAAARAPTTSTGTTRRTTSTSSRSTPACCPSASGRSIPPSATAASTPSTSACGRGSGPRTPERELRANDIRSRDDVDLRRPAMRQLGVEARFIRNAAALGVGMLALSGLMSWSDAAPGTQQDARKWTVARQGQTPLAFIENRGQVDSRVEFYLQTPGQVAWLTRDGVVFDLRRQSPGSDTGGSRFDKRRLLSKSQDPKERLVFAQDFVGADLARRIERGAAQPGVYNYFIGNDPAKW